MIHVDQSHRPQFVDIVMTDKYYIHVKKIIRPYLESIFHFHDKDVYELVWIEEGFGKRIIGDHIGEFTQGDLVLVGPHLPHKWINDNAFYTPDSLLSAKTTVIHFNGEMLRNIFGSSESKSSIDRLVEHAKRGCRIMGADNRKVRMILNRIGDDQGLKKGIRFLQIMDIFSQSKEYELLASPLYKPALNAKESKRMNDVYDYIIKRFHTPISLQEVADVCHMSPTAFCRFFKEHSNYSFVNFLNGIRINHACTLLGSPNIPVTDICYQCGFNNTANFNKFFKKITGITPLQYRSRRIEFNAG